MSKHDSTVVQYMRGWKARGTPIENELGYAMQLLKAGELSDGVANQLKNVIRYVISNGGYVLRDSGEMGYYNELNDFYAGSGLGETGDYISQPLRKSIRIVNGEWADEE